MQTTATTRLARAAGICLMLLLVFAASCGRSGTTVLHSDGKSLIQPVMQETAPLVGAGLTEAIPSPQALERQASAITPDYARIDWGSGFESSLPDNNIMTVPGPNEAQFQATGDASTKGDLSQAAYCIYQFGPLDEIPGPQQVSLLWSVAPSSPGDVYLGLSNFGQNRWDWYQPNASGSVLPPSLAAYISSSGRLYAAVVLVGDCSATLDWVLVGGTAVFDPNVYADIDPQYPELCVAPATVGFGTQCELVGTTISGIDWDFQDDGVFEVTGSDQKQISWPYTDPGDYVCRMVMHGADGTLVEDTAAFTVVNPGNALPTAVLDRDVTSGDAPLLVHLDASASTDDTYIREYEWDLDGDLVYETSTGATPDLYHYFGDKGLHLLRLRVTDSDYATDEVSEFITVDNGWRTTTLDTGLNLYGAGLAGTVLGNPGAQRACAAYSDVSTDNMYYVQAQDNTGTMWTSPIEPVDNSADTGHGLSVARSPGNRALIAYGEYDEQNPLYHSLYLVEGDSSDGALWKAPVLVCNTMNIGLFNALTLVGGNPCVFSVEHGDQQGSGKLWFFRALDAQGNDWANPVQVHGPIGSFYTGLSAGTASGKPYLACGFSYDPSNGNTPVGLGIFTTPSVNGTTWNAPQVVETDISLSCSTQVAGGRPAIAAGRGNQHGRAIFVRANDAAGLSWPAEPSQVWPQDESGRCSLAIIDGLPSVAYTSFDTGDLYYTHAVDAAGSSWIPPYTVLPLNDSNAWPLLLGPDGKPVIIVARVATDTLTAFWFEP